MNDIDATRAVEAARVASGIPADTTATWRRVERLDGKPGYLLVAFAAPSQSWVLAVAANGDVLTRARVGSGEADWWRNIDDELVWAPGSWSRSMLYPLRRRKVEGAPVLLDHMGKAIPDTQPRGG